MGSAMHNGIAVRVGRKKAEAAGISSFELVSATGAELPSFTAGAHIDVAVGNVVRQYSLCNDPIETHRYLIGVLLEANSRGGSKGMHELQEGQDLVVSAPKNLFPLAPDATRSILIAGGIGVTPLLAMAAQLVRDGRAFELHYCVRDSGRAAFLDALRQSPISRDTHLHFDDGAPSQRFDPRATLGRPATGTHLYVCGPAGFMDWVLSTASAEGWPDGQVHREYFAAAPQDESGDTEFQIRLSRSGRIFTVGATQCVTDVLATNGIEIPMSCEQGVCGTCVTRVLEGVPDHRDMFLTARERATNSCFTPCCSRALSSTLVLDL